VQGKLAFNHILSSAEEFLIQSDPILGLALFTSGGLEDDTDQTTVPLVNNPEINSVSGQDELDEFVVIPLFKQLPAKYKDD